MIKEDALSRLKHGLVTLWTISSSLWSFSLQFASGWLSWILESFCSDKIPVVMKTGLHYFDHKSHQVGHDLYIVRLGCACS